ncbi:MAG: hypothetical protein OQK98_05775 [Gammaproteobacteria bacterium]|nr:hypothetical protein [Gammaproteobacteria bacterium]
MNIINTRIIVIMSLSVAAFFPFAAYSYHNESIYNHAQHDHATSVHDLKKWKTGSNFHVRNKPVRVPVATRKVEEDHYALTEPQRKSVNPWIIKKPDNNGFSKMNAKRPWGSVPEKYSDKTKKNKKNKNNLSVINNVHANNQLKYKPFGENNLLLNQNRNPSLIPIAGHFPTYSDPGGFSPMYADPGYGYGYGYGGYNAYPFMGQGFMPFNRYGWR